MVAGHPPYRIKLHRAVLEEDSRHFNVQTKDRIKKKCAELLSKEPNKIGEPLHGELSHYRKLKVYNDYRVVYRVDMRQKIVFILAVGMRRNEEVYKEALKRMARE